MTTEYVYHCSVMVMAHKEATASEIQGRDVYTKNVKILLYMIS